MNNQKTHLPYFRNNQFIKPPEGYFILPGHVKYGYKFKDQYRYEGGWHDSMDNLDCDVKHKCEIDRYIICYARPIKGNEELYSQMAFLPEQIVTAPEGYYLLGANSKFENGDIPYWKVNGGWDFKSRFGASDMTPLQNYAEFKDFAGTVIAFARKIKPMKTYNPYFCVNLKNKQEVERFIQIIKNFDVPFHYPEVDYVKIKSEQSSFYLIFDKDNILGWNPNPYYQSEYYTYESFNEKEIIKHIATVTGKVYNEQVNYAKWQGFQVKIENVDQFDTLVKLAEKYNIDNTKTISRPVTGYNKYFVFRLHTEYRYITWDNNVYYPDKYYVYEEFNIEQFENHLKAVTNMNITSEKVDYVKWPNFQVRISNHDEFVIAQELASEYKYVPLRYVYNKFPIRIQFDSTFFYAGKSLTATMDGTTFKPEIFYDYEKFNSTQIENHLKAIVNMNNTDNKIDYAKTPNFAVKIDNDNTRVMLLALAEKYKFAAWNPVKSKYVIIAKTNLNSVGGKVYDAKHYYNQDSDPKSNTVYVYETPDWNAIIKHFEAPVVEEKKKPIVNGYEMSNYTAYQKTVIFGCANISVPMLRDILDAFNCKDGNRSLASIAFNSGKVITIEQVKEILDYVDWVNKQS